MGNFGFIRVPTMHLLNLQLGTPINPITPVLQHSKDSRPSTCDDAERAQSSIFQ